MVMKLLQLRLLRPPKFCNQLTRWKGPVNRSY